MEVILEEYPTFVGPYSKSLKQCLQCFKPWSRSGGGQRCAGCNYLVCDERCARGERHRVECRIMQKAGFR